MRKPYPEEEKEFSGVMYWPGDPELKALKLKAHNLSYDYNATHEDDFEERARIIDELFPDHGDRVFFQGPIYIHYGCHTKIGNNFFANFDFTIQDDTKVTIGDNANFGPGVSIVTPIHPMVGTERTALYKSDGTPMRLCYAKPVVIGNNCWFGANVTVCPGVTIGDNVVIGAGSVVTRDIPSNTFAAGVPCRVVREITEEDSMKHKPDILGDFLVEKP